MLNSYKIDIPGYWFGCEIQCDDIILSVFFFFCLYRCLINLSFPLSSLHPSHRSSIPPSIQLFIHHPSSHHPSSLSIISSSIQLIHPSIPSSIIHPSHHPSSLSIHPPSTHQLSSMHFTHHPVTSVYRPTTSAAYPSIYEEEGRQRWARARAQVPAS